MQISLRDCGNGEFEVIAGQARLVVDGGSGSGTDRTNFRPTELLLAALAACTASTIQGFADGNSVPGYNSVDIEAIAEEGQRPHRVTAIRLELRMAGELSADDAARLMRVGKHCKIHNTLHREPLVEVSLSADERSRADRTVR